MHANLYISATGSDAVVGNGSTDSPGEHWQKHAIQITQAGSIIHAKAGDLYRNRTGSTGARCSDGEDGSSVIAAPSATTGRDSLAALGRRHEWKPAYRQYSV